MKLCDIAIRDPYIYADEKEGEYYLYSSGVGQFGRGFCAYKSKDLENWSEPFVVFDASGFWAKDDYWAPEVHRYDGKYYLFGTFGTGGRKRTCQILVSDSPAGPFEVWSDAIAPEGWFALDATLYVKDAVPYAIFSHEWVQIDDGEMCYVKLTDDLSVAVGRPVKMFSASQSGWAVSPTWNTKNTAIYIVDAPFVYNVDGVEFMLWSSWSNVDKPRYSVGVAYPENDDMLGGKYRHSLLKLPTEDCGHAMVFKDFDGAYRICYHNNNSNCGKERAIINYLKIIDGEVKVFEND